MLVERLVKHALADSDVMTTSQVNAAKILLNKTIPDTRDYNIESVVDMTIDNDWTVNIVDAHSKPK